jgi:hypothetical protein
MDELGWANETAVGMHTIGEFAGEYVASCRLGRCGYQGELPMMSERVNVLTDFVSMPRSHDVQIWNSVRHISVEG